MMIPMAQHLAEIIEAIQVKNYSVVISKIVVLAAETARAIECFETHLELGQFIQNTLKAVLSKVKNSNSFK